jgi:anti-anti-sigma factor
MTLSVLPEAQTARVGPSLVTVVRLERTRTVVVLQGEADVSSRSVLADVLSRVIAARSGDVVIDLSALVFIDSGSIRVFAIARRWLDREDRNLTFRSPSRLAARVLNLWGLSALIETREASRP